LRATLSQEIRKNYWYTILLEGGLKKLVLPYRDYENYKPVENIFYKEFEGKLVVVGKRDGRSKLFIDGKLIETPVGSVLNAFIADSKIYYTFTSLAKPTSIMVYDGNVNREVLSAELPEDIKRSFGEVLFIRVRAPDGVEVPTFIIKSRRNLVLTHSWYSSMGVRGGR
jgi:dipeptidyl aminopeptidase/acylaminoacyl peptidase